MSSDFHSHFIARLDDFPDGGGRALLTLSCQGQRDTETWMPLSPTGDIASQHANLAMRLHRLTKIRIRHYLKGLAQCVSWKVSLNDFKRCIESSGYDTKKFFYADAFDQASLVVSHEQLTSLCEIARVAGFITGDEADLLVQGQAIDLRLDLRPAGIDPGPPITGVINEGL